MDNKGAEIAVNAVIVMVLAVLVLGAAIGIFTGVWNPGKKTTEGIGDFSSACGSFAAAGCCRDPPAGGSLPATCTDTATAGTLAKKLLDAAGGLGLSATDFPAAKERCCKG
ncbi:MAG: hypothetical protein HYS81_00805 [Candidatus Aenigmatarchaeota archaeon]|nr:MAG: hypothetical protein HYS81_00805 [Candidatus Aenigmarchaeota archaeon]